MGQQQFFNSVAERWDDTRSPNPDKLELLVNMAGVISGEHVLDVGCGTGVLSPFLKKAVGDTGRITAIDFAAEMIARAAEKNKNLAGVCYIIGDITTFRPEVCFDKIICLNFFPHIADKPAFMRNMKTMLASGGSLIIMHDISRSAVNAVHGSSAAVKRDVLPTAGAVVAMLHEAGYSVGAVHDNDELYFVKAVLNVI